MTNDIKFELDYTEFGKLLLSEELGAVMKQASRDIWRRCGNGYSYHARAGRIKQLGMVIAVSEEAIRDNSENNTLLKAIY